MRTYTVTEYDQQDYDDYENKVTLTEIIDNLEFMKKKKNFSSVKGNIRE